MKRTELPPSVPPPRGTPLPRGGEAQDEAGIGGAVKNDGARGSGKGLSPWLSRAGFFLQIASIVFVGYVLFQNIGKIPAQAFETGPLLATLAFGVFLSSAAILFQMGGLQSLLQATHGPSVKFSQVFFFHGRTAIAKYLPGNVFHFVGRQVLARGLGWSQGAVFLTSVAEAAALVSASSALGLVGLALAPEAVPFNLPPALIAAGLGGGLLVPVALVGAARLMRAETRLHAVLDPLRRIPISAWLAAWGFNLLFMASGLGAFLAGLMLFGGGTLSATPEFAALAALGYGLSYVAGFVTPGAPGGVGIREALLVVCLGPHAGAATVGAAAVLARVGGIVAESLCWMATFFLFSRAKP